jgi:hypothetical protein
MSSLAALFVDRCMAYAAMSTVPLSSLDPSDRALDDRRSATFRAADAAIVAKLRKLKAPPIITVKGKAAVLQLTSDKLNFYAAEPGTGRPVVWSPKEGFVPLNACMVRGIA